MRLKPISAFVLFLCALLLSGCIGSDVLTPKTKTSIDIGLRSESKNAPVDSGIVFYCILTPKPSSSVLYQWEFGDGNYTLQTIDADSILYHYLDTGFFHVSVTAFDMTSGDSIGKADTFIHIHSTLTDSSSFRGW